MSDKMAEVTEIMLDYPGAGIVSREDIIYLTIMEDEL